MERIDWNSMWNERRALLSHNHSVEYWNEFAPRFRKDLGPGEQDAYVEQFYEYAGIRPGDTIFDMGCGSGTLAIPYAMRGHDVFAADFSPRMLEFLMIGAKEKGVENRIHPIQLDWNEDWSTRDLPKCDIVIASRSVVFKELTDALLKLESVARRKVCIGAWDTPTAHYDRNTAKWIGYDRPGYGCYVYILNELIDRDLLPELRFIRYAASRKKYSTREALESSIRDSFQYGLTDAQERRLRQYLDSHVCCHEEPGRTYYQVEGSSLSTIAHISWEPPAEPSQD